MYVLTYLVQRNIKSFTPPSENFTPPNFCILLLLRYSWCKLLLTVLIQQEFIIPSSSFALFYLPEYPLFPVGTSRERFLSCDTIYYLLPERDLLFICRLQILQLESELGMLSIKSFREL